MNINGRPLRVCLDPGHGGADSGAVGQNGLQEADVVLEVAKILKGLLTEDNCHVWLTREKDVTLKLSERTATAKIHKCDLFLSIHCNAADAKLATGMETLWGSGQPRSLKFAQKIQMEMVKAFPDHKDRGLRESPSTRYPRSIYVVRNNPCPSALVELEFISNSKMEKLLSLKETKEKIAQALRIAILDYAASL